MSNLETNDFTESNFVQNQRLNELAGAVNGLVVSPATEQQTIVLFGDSFSDAQGSKNPAYLDAVTQISCWRFLLARLGNSQKVIKNAGIIGNTSGQMLSRVKEDVIPYKSDWVFMQCGANDFYGLTPSSSETVFYNITAILEELLKDGRKILICNSAPQSNLRSPFTPAMNLESQKYNKMLREYCAGKVGVLYADIYSATVDWSDTTNSSSFARYLGNDGIHLSNYGSLAWADVTYKKLAPHFAKDTSANVYPQTGGIIGGKGVFAGTSGTVGSGVTGVVATGWDCRRGSGTNGTGVASKIPNGQKVVFTTVAANGSANLRVSCTGSANFISDFTPHIGKRVACKVRARVSSTGGVSLKKIEFKLAFVDAVTGLQIKSNGFAVSGFPVVEDFPFDTEECVFDISSQTIPNMTTSSSNGFFFDIDVDSIAGGTFTLELYSVEVYEV